MKSNINLLIKTKLVVAGLLMLGACASLTPTQNIITACEAGERARYRIAAALDAGQITSPSKIERILAVSNTIHAVCTNRELVSSPNSANIAITVAEQTAILTDALLEIE